MEHVTKQSAVATHKTTAALSLHALEDGTFAV